MPSCNSNPLFVDFQGGWFEPDYYRSRATKKFRLSFHEPSQGKESIFFQPTELWLLGLLQTSIPRVWSRWPCVAPWYGCRCSLLGFRPIKLWTKVEGLWLLTLLSSPLFGVGLKLWASSWSKKWILLLLVVWLLVTWRWPLELLLVLGSSWVLRKWVPIKWVLFVQEPWHWLVLRPSLGLVP